MWVRIPPRALVRSCKFCNKEFERGQQTAGHQTWCNENPNSRSSAAKIAKKQRGVRLSEQIRSRIRATISAKIMDETWHCSFAKRRKHAYGGAAFDGTWELKFAQWCDANAVHWERNTRSFPYCFERSRQYTPDFYLPDANCYVEIKGWAYQFGKYDFLEFRSFDAEWFDWPGRDERK